MDKLGQLLGAFQRDGVVVGGTDAADAAVALETSQAQDGGSLEEALFGLVCVSVLGFRVSIKLLGQLMGS